MKPHPLQREFPLKWMYSLAIFLALSLPAYGAESIDGFRDLKFGMTPLQVQILENCQTSRECMYELSNKNRYLQLTYNSDSTESETDLTADSQLSRITIDMGHFTDEWYQQLQVILGNSYRLTSDFSEDLLNAFMAKQFQQLEAGYEDGQVILQVIRRPFGNVILKVVYQNSTLAKEFKQPVLAPPSTTP